MEKQLHKQAMQNGKLFYSIAFRILKNEQAAEDVCQQAFLKAYEKKDNLKSTDALKGWLARTVTNECFQVLRRRKVEAKYISALERQENVSTPSHGKLENQEWTNAALDDLPEKERVVVTLRIMNNLSGREVAGMLGISEPEVSKRLYSGMENLRKRYMRDNGKTFAEKI